jgi:hypothetical protein
VTKADRDEILALAEKVERMTEPESVEAAYLERDIYRVASNNPDAEVLDAPRYLISLDAAMSLVPEGASLDLSGPRRYLNIPTPVPNYWSAKIFTHDGSGPHTKWGATPALALTAAALRAHAAKENDDG